MNVLTTDSSPGFSSACQYSRHKEFT